MGLHFLGLTPIALLMREKRLEVAKPVGLWGAYLMGLAFALGWTPCIGPILAAILAVAASEATVAKGAGLLAIYSLGLGIPFIAAALAIEPFAAFLARFRAHLGLVEKAMGGLLVLTGIAFLTGAVTQASFWLLDTFPMLGKIGLTAIFPSSARVTSRFCSASLLAAQSPGYTALRPPQLGDLVVIAVFVPAKHRPADGSNVTLLVE